MSQNQAYTYIIDTAANLPTNATEGVIAYAKDDNTVYAYDGSTWNAVGGSSYTNLDFLENNYHPDRPPASLGTGGLSEEWTSGADTNTWSWGNQGSSTATYEMDGITLYTPAAATNNMRGYCVAIPTSTDFVVYAKMEADATDAFVTLGLGVLRGTPASPTRIDQVVLRMSADSTSTFTHQTWTNWTTFSATNYTWTGGSDSEATRPVYLRIRYETSSTTVWPEVSLGGKMWVDNIRNTSGVNIGGDPDYACLVIASEDTSVAVRAHFSFFRLRTDSNKLYCGA